jgi:chromosome segregation ATPase
MKTALNTNDYRSRFEEQSNALELKLRRLVHHCEVLERTVDDRKAEITSLKQQIGERDTEIREQNATIREMKKKMPKNRASRVLIENLNPDDPETLKTQIDQYIKEVDRAIQRLSE